MWKGFLAVVCLLLLLIGCQRGKALPPTGTNILATESTHAVNAPYEDLEGNPIRLSDYKGKRIILHFWATWCKPCIEEMPSLKLAKPLLEKENYLLLLPSDQTSDEIKAYQRRYDPGLTLIRYTGALSQLNIYALPTTLILNEDGEKVKEISGRMDWDSEHTINGLINLY